MKSRIGVSNPMYGRKHSLKTIQKMSEIKIGENNPLWKGNDITIKRLHYRIKTHFPKPDLCACCRRNAPHDLANISGQYKHDLKDWTWLCRRCHMLSDGRMMNLKQYGQM